jgi:hypothetical protein
MDTVMKDIQAVKMVNWEIEIDGSQLLSRPRLMWSCGA